MSKYNVGDKFLIEIEEALPGICNGVLMNKLYRVKGFNALVFDEFGLDKLPRATVSLYTDDELKKVKSEAYEAGLKEAWNAARKIVCIPENGGFTNNELCKIFGNTAPTYILAAYKVRAALYHIKEYEMVKRFQLGCDQDAD